MCSSTTRRGFLVGCSAAIAGMAGSRFNSVAFGSPEGGVNNEIMLMIFLRGGLDGLNLIPPIDGPDRGHYETGRPNLAVPASGPDAAISLDGQFGLHPSAAPLFDLFQDNKLSIVHAVGLDESTRSHFDAMESIELGTPGVTSGNTGWLTRHIQTATNLPSEIIMPSLSVGNLRPTSLLGDTDGINLEDPGQFNLETGPYSWRDAQRVAMRHLFQTDTSWLHNTGLQALDAMDVIDLNVNGAYNPANGAVYPGGSFGDHLQVVAQMAKLELGLRVATIDLGGWDTHNGQGDGSGGYFSGLIQTLAEGLAALYLDLDGAGAANYTNRLTVVVQSEFGRRLRENDDHGTDHGHGNVMMVLSGNATGGIHGPWPGLAPGQLFDNADLQVATDYRQVLSEILIRRMGNPNLGVVFPGYGAYNPIGVVQGGDLTPIYDQVFGDGFETGNTSAWSAAVGS